MRFIKKVALFSLVKFELIISEFIALLYCEFNACLGYMFFMDICYLLVAYLLLGIPYDFFLSFSVIVCVLINSYPFLSFSHVAVCLQIYRSINFEFWLTSMLIDDVEMLLSARSWISLLFAC